MPEPQRSESPTGDVEYDEDALEEAVEGMHAEGTGDAHEPDPDDTHDAAALEEAAKQMKAEP